MKQIIALVIMLSLAMSAVADDNDNSLGMFFTDDIAGIIALDDPTNPPNEPFHPDSNYDSAAGPFNGYIVLLYPTADSIAGYEVGIEFSDASLFVLSASGPNGWTNFGGNTNHLVGYGTPVPVTDGGVVLGTMNMLYSGSDTVNIDFFPATPSSFGDTPGFADGDNPDLLIPCTLASAPRFWPTVATINGEGVVAVNNRSLSSVKAMFD